MASQRSRILKEIDKLNEQLAGIPEGPDLGGLPTGATIKFEKHGGGNPTGVHVAVKATSGMWWASFSIGSNPSLAGDELAELVGTGRCWVLVEAGEITAAPSDPAGD